MGKIKTPAIQEFNSHLVISTGFGPVNAAVKGQCVKPLHQLAINGGPEWT